ncbi:ArnT family glycosyltransferase [Adhaeribacter radiodurans]|uniref:Glycosyltransferase family 39 protein n=1 Tax=Adhaeribacter radiodurans TaxID=2745197 RepID=A0A7L7L538_9BACT|nr:glycosyltransferase family 39 protein [Adhaeribacter radiodurans]QMU27916.1 glycosyltransferase family 39 protein [Adhaeribacter radiodurans]
MKFSLQNNQYWVLWLLWLVATILNSTKAFHIDDTFHIEAAQWIERHPFKPMSGLIFWSNGYAPIYTYNQPPLYFYFLAVIGHFFSYSEFVLHLFQSGFTFLAIIYFYKLTQIVVPKHALLTTCFLVLNPAFLVNQNVMVDIPLLSLHLLFIYLLIKPSFKNEWLRYGFAASILSLALLLKYTSLPLLIVLAAHPIITKKFKYLATILLPLGVLALWSGFNISEFGSIHLNRPTSSLTLLGVALNLMAFIVCLGAITPFSLLFVAGFTNKYRKNFGFLAFITIPLFIALVVLTYFDFIPEREAKRILWMCSFANGFTLLYLLLDTQPLVRIFFTTAKSINQPYHLLYLWLVVISGFIIFFAPFTATWHVLLIMPAIIILGTNLIDYASQKLKVITIVFTGTFSLLLGASDWIYANTYRTQAYAIKSKLLPENTTWSVGFWGWQWYNKKAGIKPYVAGKSKVKPHDYFVIPANIAPPKVVDTATLKQVDEIIVKSNFCTFFSCSNFPGMYSSDYANPP